MGSTKADRPYGTFRPARSDESAPVSAPPEPSRLARLRAKLRGIDRRDVVLAALLLAVAGSLLGGVLRQPPLILSPRQVDLIARLAIASATPRPEPAIAVYDQVRPAVVSIRVRFGSTTGPESSGSGVVFDESGQILTALHVVGGASTIRVIFANGQESIAGIVSQIPQSDIAVIKAATPPPGLTPATLGDASALRIGESVYVIGDPFGLTGSFSSGVISGLNRSISVPGRAQPIPDLIQFDAAVNPGSSGGPLLNRSGDVVGIVTGIAQSGSTGRDAFAGVSFAVKIQAAASAGGSPPY